MRFLGVYSKVKSDFICLHNKKVHDLNRELINYIILE